MERREMITEIAELATAMFGTHSRLLEQIVDADSSGIWQHDGATSCAAWLVARLGVSYHTARTWVETAAALTDLPETAQAFAEGALTFDQVRILCRCTDPASEHDDIEEARWSSVDHLQRLARRRQTIELGALELAYRRRAFRWRHDEKRRCLILGGELPDDWEPVLAAAIERIAMTTPTDPELGVHEGFWPRAADALYEMASQSLGADRDPDRATIVVHIDGSHLANSEGGVGITDGGSALHPETVRRLSCDGRRQTVLDGSDGLPVGVGRTGRVIPPWLGRQLAYRDEGCRFPGCGRRIWVHGHHIVHWAHGGPTDLENLITLCGHHHRLIHERGWRITGDPNADVLWIRPDGTPYEPTMIEEDLALTTRLRLDESRRGTVLRDTS
jgi:hypothetical protein